MAFAAEHAVNRLAMLHFDPQIMKEHHLPPGDFPDPSAFGEILSPWDLSVSTQARWPRRLVCPELAFSAALHKYVLGPGKRL